MGMKPPYTLDMPGTQGGGPDVNTALASAPASFVPGAPAARTASRLGMPLGSETTGLAAPRANVPPTIGGNPEKTPGGNATGLSPGGPPNPGGAGQPVQLGTAQDFKARRGQGGTHPLDMPGAGSSS